MRPLASPEAAVEASSTSLRRLRRGQVAVVLAVNHELAAVRQKYHARGIVPGARLEVLQAGDPVVVALEESRWAVDGDEAGAIEVALLDAGGARWWQRAMQSLRGGGGQP
jgi:Fe2+ transport system protein FeoA